MEHLGQTLKNHIEINHLKKSEIAKSVGISYNYLSTLFNKSTMDCALWEKLCMATGLNPSIAFSTPILGHKNYSDIQAKSFAGPATVTIGSDQKILLDLLAEKERLIKVLLAASGLKIGTESGQEQ